MSTIPQLMANISPESELVQSLKMLTFEQSEDEHIMNAVDQAINHKSLSTSLYPSLDEYLCKESNLCADKCQKAKELTSELFTDDGSVEYFILTPLPDDNAHEEFASSTDLLVLRWPMGLVQPWDADGETVLDIDDLNLNQE